MPSKLPMRKPKSAKLAPHELWWLTGDMDALRAANRFSVLMLDTLHDDARERARELLEQYSDIVPPERRPLLEAQLAGSGEWMTMRDVGTYWREHPGCSVVGGCDYADEDSGTCLMSRVGQWVNAWQRA